MLRGDLFQDPEDYCCGVGIAFSLYQLKGDLEQGEVVLNGARKPVGCNPIPGDLCREVHLRKRPSRRLRQRVAVHVPFPVHKPARTDAQSIADPEGCVGAHAFGLRPPILDPVNRRLG